ncbi:hypothetical protein RJ641_029921 [Dillenia turbinata]|uniref:Rhodanese domain-containing protein n=1 Tax=Dillenia turbinata TaxID=194707 RepID=A0AAN8VUN6_9MAGN
MRSLSVGPSSYPPLQNHPITPHKPSISLPSCFHHSTSSSKTSNSPDSHIKNATLSNTQLLLLHLKASLKLKPHLSFALLGLPLSTPPSLASEIVNTADPASDKISLESILIAIDDFFNRNPFFVSGVAFIWLIVIPLTRNYFNKYKFIKPIDAFRRLRDDPTAELLDIRDGKSSAVLGSPSLKILNKGVTRVEYLEGDEDGFVKKVKESFSDPENTILCILDNFDGNSMKAAELLFKGGFKETYAIRGGVRGKDGWQAIQEELLPPSVHMTTKKKGKRTRTLKNNGSASGQDNSLETSSTSIPVDGSVQKGNNNVNSSPEIKYGSRSSSPYPNYPDLKPPSSPTPSKP